MNITIKTNRCVYKLQHVIYVTPSGNKIQIDGQIEIYRLRNGKFEYLETHYTPYEKKKQFLQKEKLVKNKRLLKKYFTETILLAEKFNPDYQKERSYAINGVLFTYK